MMKIEDYKNKHILVLGLAVSGYSAAKVLHELGATVTVNDYKNLEGNEEANELNRLGIRVISGGHPLSLLDDSLDMIVKNPGIPYSNPLLVEAQKREIPILTDIEIAYTISRSPIVGITGTNGKTTTTKMIEALLQAGIGTGHIYSVGNIGTPAASVALKSRPEDTLLMEVSSFQLMGTDTFKPKIAVITNIHSAHLDYHGSRNEYVMAKMNITKNQSEDDILIYNHDQLELTERVISESNATLLPFSRKEVLDKGVYIHHDMIYFNQESVMKTSDIVMPGKHNLENALAAIAVAKLNNVSNQAIEKAFKHFHGVPHRLQFVDEINNRKFYNDSKATNSLAAINALEGFNQKVILLAGGLDRGDNFEDLIPAFRKHVKYLYTFGETAHKLADIGQEAEVGRVKAYDTLTDAVTEAYSKSEPGDIILLSPACASWDAYSNFEARGQDFIENLTKIKTST
ncbi:MAG: UDP-N-acetylmuramoyl-L-alanine--D-glutamate ligase [Alkalibacterium sp.]|nr:UDP-N-acetylmuramoyl-L-alanine--D-glutamate ligase [Alkalibacterium sp.]